MSAAHVSHELIVIGPAGRGASSSIGIVGYLVYCPDADE